MAAQNTDALFAHLMASRPGRVWNPLAWLVAALINIAIVALFLLTTSMPVSQRVSPVVPAVVLVNDEPILLARPALGSAGTIVDHVAAAPLTMSLAPTTSISPSVAGAPPSTGKASPVAPKTLRDRMGQPEPLLGARSTIVTARSPLDEARARIELEVGSLNDSIAAEEIARKKAKDWTIGGEGNRWGISPSGIHLGKVTPRLAYATNNVPPPDVIVPPPGRRDEANARARSWQEIETGAARAEQRTVIEQRAKSIRSRVDDARTRSATRKNE